MKKIRIIIPAYYDSEYLVRCIESIKKHTDLNLVNINIIDDTGDIEFFNFISAFLKEKKLESIVTLKHNENNIGALKTVNDELSILEEDFALILHSDTIVYKGWLENMLNLFDQNKTTALVNPIMNELSYAGISLSEGTNVNNIVAFINSYNEKDSSVLIPSDSCIMIRKEYLDTYGGLDINYENLEESIADLHFRFRSQGLNSHISTHSFVYHIGKNLTQKDWSKVELLMKRYEHVMKGEISFNATSNFSKIKADFESKPENDIDVLIISPSNNVTGGGVKVIHDIANALNETGISANLACTWLDRIEYKLDALYKPFFYKNLTSFQLKPKVIVFSLDHNAYEVIKYIRHIENQFGYTPKIVNLGQDVEGWFEGHDLESFFAYSDIADYVMTVSPFVQNVLKERFPKKNIQTITNAISSNFYCEYLKVQNLSKTKDNAEIVLSAMIREDSKRGANVIYEALEKVSKKLTKTVRFVSFGSPIRLNKKLDNIIEEGYDRIPEYKVKEIAARSHCVLEASFYQGFGLVALEGLLTNNFVISSTNEGAKGVLPDSDRIKYFKVGDSDELAEAILEFINNPVFYNSIDMNIIKSSARRFKVQEYQDYFRNILSDFKEELNSSFERKAIDALLQYYKFIELHYLFDAPLKTRYKLVDKIVDPFLKLDFLKKISSKVVMFFKR